MSLLTKSWINWHLFLHKICPNYFFRFHSSLSYRYLYLRSANGTLPGTPNYTAPEMIPSQRKCPHHPIMSTLPTGLHSVRIYQHPEVRFSTEIIL